jgi:AraC-like DNA-binding protein
MVFFEQHTLVLLVSGNFQMTTSGQKVVMKSGQILLVHKNQLAEITKMPDSVENYETIIIALKEEMLRQIAQEKHISLQHKYQGPLNVLIPENDLLRGFFGSLVPYVRHSEEQITDQVAILKVKEGVQLLLHALPELKNFLFDFSDPHKIDLERYMLSNFQFNVPIQQFAKLTGRSLAAFKRDFHKIFAQPPRHWLQEKRLMEAYYRLEHKKQKPSAVYLDLGFKTFAHFSYAFKKKFGKAPSELL